MHRHDDRAPATIADVHHGVFVDITNLAALVDDGFKLAIRREATHRQRLPGGSVKEREVALCRLTLSVPRFAEAVAGGGAICADVAEPAAAYGAGMAPALHVKHVVERDPVVHEPVGGPTTIDRIARGGSSRDHVLGGRVAGRHGSEPAACPWHERCGWRCHRCWELGRSCSRSRSLALEGGGLSGSILLTLPAHPILEGPAAAGCCEARRH
mmetsp:Transcript_20297/g.54602  ORF Transcript_20297/g.54602 Transcript_20297/m.54602 type:complete len:212 (+) Transcript_20297:540-1175(+)